MAHSAGLGVFATDVCMPVVAAVTRTDMPLVQL
jgi:hypothetical protein